jgi:hypothetical protein
MTKQSHTPQAAEMTSSAFISYTVEISHRATSWEAADAAFAGPPRWDATVTGDVWGSTTPSRGDAARCKPRRRSFAAGSR